MADSIRFFSVWENGEWGSFFLRSGILERDDQEPQYWCELTCRTAFGCVGHFWGHMGRPADKFLTEVSKDYVLKKLWGADSTVFCGSEAWAYARRLILDDRRHGDLSQEQARDRWDDLEHEDWGNEADFISFVHRCDWIYLHLVEGGGGTIGKVPNPQAEGFWNDLWPGFIRQLNAGGPTR